MLIHVKFAKFQHGSILAEYQPKHSNSPFSNDDAQ